MSTIKSSDEHLTINADGSGKAIKFQANGVEKASISSSGAFTSTTIDATKLTGTIPNFTSTGIDDNADATAITINSSENVGIGQTSPSYRLHVETSVDGDFASLIHNTDADNGQGLMIRAGADSGEAILSLRNQASSEQFKVLADGDIYHSDYAGGKGIWSEVITNGVQQIRKCNTSSDFRHIYFANSNGTVGRIATSNSSTSYVTSSDYRLKENVDYTWDATTRLKQLKPARFNFIADDTNTLVDGFIAHEVSSVVPEAVSGEKDAMTAEVLYKEGDDIPEGKKVGDVKTAAAIDPQGIDQSKLVPLLVKTIQELEARITALEA